MSDSNGGSELIEEMEDAASSELSEESEESNGRVVSFSVVVDELLDS